MKVPYIKLSLLLIFCVGTILGIFLPVSAKPQFSYAGYKWNVSLNLGGSAEIPYANPYVPPAGQSLEWVMSYDGTHYIQSGWIKKYGHTDPSYFVEYNCPTVCEFLYGAVPSNTTHIYKVELISPNWCGYIDGVSYKCVDVGTLGMAAATNVAFSGETSDTRADLGGTPSNHLRMNAIMFKDALTFNWYQMNTTEMINILTPNTPYADSIGFTNPYVWVENWTVR